MPLQSFTVRLKCNGSQCSPGRTMPLEDHILTLVWKPITTHKLQESLFFLVEAVCESHSLGEMRLT